MKPVSRFSPRHLLAVAAVMLFVVSCKQPLPAPPQSEEPDIVEAYPATPLPEDIFTSISDQQKLYPVSENFLREFLLKITDYEGTHVKITTPFPEEWGVLSMEQLPEGRELWLMQSVSREWKYLVITSGLGTQRVLDVLPVSVNLAMQDQDILETENWSTRLQADGSFIVDKQYEWVKSLSPELSPKEVRSDPAAYSRTRAVSDHYFINDLCRFEFIPPKDTLNHQIVIFYYNPENKPEEWDNYIPILQSYCEEKEICYEEVHEHFEQVVVRDLHMNEVAVVDITPYISQQSDAGMLMIKSGETPKQVSFGNNERLKVEIRRYFNLLNQN
ncbi:MAG: hypothetical protein LBR51_08075 [Bacteroidales bacterium]|nr:hypothetical protein [Bacteroidales bacterium]